MPADPDPVPPRRAVSFADGQFSITPTGKAQMFPVKGNTAQITSRFTSHTGPQSRRGTPMIADRKIAASWAHLPSLMSKSSR